MINTEVERNTGSLSKNIVWLCYEHRGNDTWSLNPTSRPRKNGTINTDYTSALVRSLF